MEVTKEQFLNAYNRFPPSKWVKFVFKYFSKKTAVDDEWLRKSIISFLLFLFLVGFVGTILKWGTPVMKLATLTFVFVLVVVGIIMSTGAILNNLRIRKIRKLLGVSRYEYNKLVDKYF